MTRMHLRDKPAAAIIPARDYSASLGFALPLDGLQLGSSGSADAHQSLCGSW